MHKDEIINNVLREVISKQQYSVYVTHKGKLDKAIFKGDHDDCESFIRTFPIKEKNKLWHEDKSLSIVNPEGRELPSINVY